jgi:hypothetical protein
LTKKGGKLNEFAEELINFAEKLNEKGEELIDFAEEFK